MNRRIYNKVDVEKQLGIIVPVAMDDYCVSLLDHLQWLAASVKWLEENMHHKWSYFIADRDLNNWPTRFDYYFEDERDAALFKIFLPSIEPER